MAEYGHVGERVRDLAVRAWDVPGIVARYRRLLVDGIPRKDLDVSGILTRTQEILDRVQWKAEEYEYLGHNCAKGAALAVMEEFGLGSVEMLKGLSAFPGFGVTGSVCGAVSGALFVFGLYFGRDDMTDYGATGAAITAARVFIPRFEAQLGSILCPRIQEDYIFGRYLDARASPEHMATFIQEQGYAKCALPAGVGARLAAELIIESLQATP